MPIRFNLNISPNDDNKLSKRITFRVQTPSINWRKTVFVLIIHGFIRLSIDYKEDT